MADKTPNDHTESDSDEKAPAESLRRALADGKDWLTALLETMAQWSSPTERHGGRTYNYFIAGEAFDWLLLAERLCQTVDGLLPPAERDDLLFSGRFPSSFDKHQFKKLLGVEKYRGYLNYYYGVTVEEALQLATELEVHKRHASNGVHYEEDYSREAFTKIYGAGKSKLLRAFRQECEYGSKGSMGLTESKEFTYWLFKYRLKVSDKARIASDTKRGLGQLRRMTEATGRTGHSFHPEPGVETPSLERVSTTLPRRSAMLSSR